MSPSGSGELSNPQFQSSPSPGQGGSDMNASPMSGQGNPEVMENLKLVNEIVRNARMLAQKVPGAVDIIRQINDLTQKLQMKLIQNGPTPQPQAPPIA